METAGLALVFGMGLQVICLLLSTILWLARGRITPALWAPWPTGVGGLAGWIALMIPANQLLRIGPRYLPACLSEEACRADVIFCTMWIVGALFLIGLQVWLYRRIVKG